jgi:beta-lactam-binding protein with PASTA domain
MATFFHITPVSAHVALDVSRRGKATFTVTNASGLQMQARARVMAMDPNARGWFRLAEDPERTYNDGDTTQYTVQIAVPAGAPAGQFSFRLDVVGVENPDEDYTEGPPVQIVVLEALEQRKPFPWWILAVVGGVLLVAGILVVVLLTRGVEIPNVEDMPQALAEKELANLGFEITISREPSRGVDRDKATRTDPPAGEKAKRGSAITLYLSSGLPQVPVPSVSDTSVPEAEGIMSDAGLEVAANAASSPHETIVEGRVIDADPPAGTLVDEGAEVRLVLSSGLPCPGTVPDVSTQSPAQASAMLEEACYKVDPSTVGERHPTIAQGLVIRSEPPAGANLESNSAVALILSEGPPPVIVPATQGRTQADTRTRISAAGLVPAAAIRQENHNTVAKDLVVGTDPAAGEEWERGTEVILIVSLGPGQVPVPQVQGLTVAQATTRIENEGLRIEGSSRLAHSSVPVNQAVGTQPPAGTKVPPGSAVTLLVSRGPMCSTQMMTVPASRFSYHPPRTEGDAEFGGNGPDVTVRVNVYAQAQTLKAEVYMRAQEKDGDSLAEGTTTINLYQVPPGQEIRGIVGSTSASQSYVDDDHGVDVFDKGSDGPVGRFEIIGDTRGNDIGSGDDDTGVNVRFNPIRIETVTTNNCAAARVTVNFQQVTFASFQEGANRVIMNTGAGWQGGFTTTASTWISFNKNQKAYPLNKGVSMVLRENEPLTVSAGGVWWGTRKTPFPSIPWLTGPTGVAQGQHPPGDEWDQGTHTIQSDKGEYEVQYMVQVNWLQ